MCCFKDSCFLLDHPTYRRSNYSWVFNSPLLISGYTFSLPHSFCNRPNKCLYPNWFIREMNPVVWTTSDPPLSKECLGKEGFYYREVWKPLCTSKYIQHIPHASSMSGSSFSEGYSQQLPAGYAFRDVTLFLPDNPTEAWHHLVCSLKKNTLTLL